VLRRLLSIFRTKPRPDVRIVHPQLGPLTFQDEEWRGHVPKRNEVEFGVPGGESGPCEEQVERLWRLLAGFDKFEQQIFDFLDQELVSVPVVEATDFRIQSVELTTRTNYVIVFLSMEGDEYGLWRIEFIDGKPISLGRDD
jgi:hypothetical protein